MGRKEIENLEELKDIKVEITEKEFKIARKTARSFSVTTGMCSEDIEQDVLEKLVKYKKRFKLETGNEPEENLALIKAIVQNKAVEISRKRKREKEKMIYMDMNSSCSDDRQEQAESVLSRLGANIESFEEIKYSEYEAIELVAKFMENEIDNRFKSVFVAMGYVNSGLEFLREPYEKLVKNLDENKREVLEDLLNKNNGKMTNDTAYKIFGGLETGVNSGSAWKIRKALDRFKRLADGEDVKEVYAELKRA